MATNDPTHGPYQDHIGVDAIRRRQRLNERLRAAFIAGAEEDSRLRLGRGLTKAELAAGAAAVSGGRVAAVSYPTDAGVDAYIEALPGWQREICRQVRDLVHAVDADIVETTKREGQPYFVLQGNICALLAARDHVNVFLYDGGIVPDPAGIITGGHDNKTARTVAIRQSEQINGPALGAMFRQIIANNRAGGWRKLKDAGGAHT